VPAPDVTEIAARDAAAYFATFASPSEQVK
jgi:hypothetical protein